MKPVYIGKNKLQSAPKTVRGDLLQMAGETWYRISNVDAMPPFFMSIVSDSDHWMYIWSTGALSAGRRNPDHALFPYYTDDKILDYTDRSGSKIILLVEQEEGQSLWEPFSERSAGIYNVERNLYKNRYGNKLIFEEVNHELGLTYRYAWLSSEKFGFVKKSTLENISDQPIDVSLLDGLQNILPAGVKQEFQNGFSTLADAYKKSELEADGQLGLFSLSSIPVDRAEPSESLRANTVWSVGIDVQNVLLSSEQLDVFKSGGTLRTETNMRARRGGYFVHSALRLAPAVSKTWYFAAELDQDITAVVNLKRFLQSANNIEQQLEADVDAGTQNLLRLVGQSDGLQKSADAAGNTRHFSNVLFNIMRGGIPDEGYTIDTEDFRKFVQTVNRPLFKAQERFLSQLPPQIRLPELKKSAQATRDAALIKLSYEYLPLTFGRRHGDPSRPWNRFSIDIKDEYGQKALNYQGNWRDIFQNWEALALSYPEFIRNMISKFVNASTMDGYNPYRVTRDGYDWEVLDPNDAWSYIGYWGDHQIIYLLKLLEISAKYHPGKLAGLLGQEIFTYARVPYRIAAYEHMLQDPYNTVTFDDALEREIEARVQEMGSDGKCVLNGRGELLFVNLAEKLLVPILAKLTNFIPEAGIWMNTQRPEWNDANNALVGNGASVVTLCYLYRHLKFCAELFASAGNDSWLLSAQVHELFISVLDILKANRGLLEKPFSNHERKLLTDLLGSAGSDYRQAVYQTGPGEKKQPMTANDARDFFNVAAEYVDHSIRANRREDGLYHAYNLVDMAGKNAITIRHLYEMLEGQVAVLSSGLLSAEKSLALLDTLRNSALYRADQDSYMLYPNRSLAQFTEKNIIAAEAVRQSKLLQTLLDQDNRDIIIKDGQSSCHFHADFRNGNVLRAALEALDDPQLQSLVDKEKEQILALYEDMFDHRSFTGRSGTFFKYEGLGSIYWHMVSKLLLAVQETMGRALAENDDQKTIEKLKAHFHAIKKGIGAGKSPELYGGFPTDPYSHTPAHLGAQQPGMTGQVKEDILSRFGELGVLVENGGIRFEPQLLRREEFIAEKSVFEFIDVEGQQQSIELPQGSLAFTLCQVPVVYTLAKKPNLALLWKDGKREVREALQLSAEETQALTGRGGQIRIIEVQINDTIA